MKRAAVLLLVAGPALAEPRPAPDYFVDVTFATTTAQALARACPTLSLELLQASRASGEVMDRLAADGFDLDALVEEMADPAPQFDALRQDFLRRHGLADGAVTDKVCAAGEAEIAAQSQIGAFLVTVPAQ